MGQTAGEHRDPPSATLADLARLVVRLAGGVLRRGRSVKPDVVVREWYQDIVRRTGSENLVLNLRFKKFLVVTERGLSRHIAAPAPDKQGYVAGPAKVRAMSFLAPNALTIAHGEQWQRLRDFNESVLAVESEPDMRFVLSCVRKAFPAPVSDMADIRRCMGEAMRMVVFGPGKAPKETANDMLVLVRHVHNPARRILLGWRQARRRKRFYLALHQLWATAAADDPSLIGRAKGLARHRNFSDRELVEQIPHWMFTFTGSGTELLARTLGVLGSRDDVYGRARVDAVRPDSADGSPAVADMDYLGACLLETCRLFPPVTRTFHVAPRGDTFEQGRIPAGMEILHCFTEGQRDVAADPTADDFRPERWLEPGSRADAMYPSLFLGGARTCPGRSLILFVCKAAISVLMEHGRIRTRCGLPDDPMPPSFPEGGLRYETDSRANTPDTGRGHQRGHESEVQS